MKNFLVLADRRVQQEPPDHHDMFGALVIILTVLMKTVSVVMSVALVQVVSLLMSRSVELAKSFDVQTNRWKISHK